MVARFGADPTRAPWRGVIDPAILRALPSAATAVAASRRTTLLARWPGVSASSRSPGPTWQREPSPFADAKPPVMVVLKVTPSMTGGAISRRRRLERARQKLSDLLAMREGAATGLVAYAGSAASRAAADAGSGRAWSPWPQALSPEIMPKDGDDLAAAPRLG